MKARVRFAFLSGATCVALVVAGVSGWEASAQARAVSTLSKTAQNQTHPGSATATHGDSLRWVSSYTNTAGAADTATITDPITGAGSAQTYVPGSFDVPPGWTPEWSTDGSTFTGTDPGTATKAVRATNPTARPGGTDISSPVTPPLGLSVAAVGGDGFQPFLYHPTGGGLEAWSIFHHLSAALPKVVCVDVTTGAVCGGGPWPKPLNTTPGPFGAGNTGDIASTLAFDIVADPDRPGIVYYPGESATSVGVGCLDLAARANCGFFPLAASGGTPSAVNDITGFVATGGNLYGAITTGQVVCFTMDTQAPCAGQPWGPVVAPNNNVPGGTSTFYTGMVTLAAGQVFVASSPPGSPPVLSCFDPTTQARCTGWAADKVGGVAGQITYAPYTAYDTSGAEVGACTAAVATGVPTTTCFAVDGAPLTAPNAFSALPSGVLVWGPPETITALDGHLRSYWGAWGGPLAGAAVCWDWTAAAKCAGFPDPATHPGVNGGATRDYGYAYEPETGCMIANGDAGVLFSMDPVTGAAPCLRTRAGATLTPEDFYCDGAAGHVQGYADARLENVDVANVSIAQSSVNVADEGADVFATLPLAVDGSVDLSGISVTAHPSITVTGDIALIDDDDFGGATEPRLVVAFDGDAPQFCVGTTVSTSCSVTAVSDTSTGTDATGSFTSATVSVPVSGGPGCQPVTPPADKTAPVLTGARLDPRLLPTGKGATLQVTSTEAAKLVGQVQRKRSRGGWASAGTKRWSVAVGANAKRFYGRTAEDRLRTGKYRVLLVATDAAGNVSSTVTFKFRVDRG